MAIPGRNFVFSLDSATSAAYEGNLLQIRAVCPFSKTRRARAVPHPPSPIIVTISFDTKSLQKYDFAAEL
jgi:hypothetical protein